MKRKINIIYTILLAVSIDQAIKIYISRNMMNKEFDILGNILGFSPYVNSDYSWINSISNLGINRITHIIVNVLMIFIIFMAYDFIKTRYTASNYIKVTFTFLFAGGICSLIDKVAWGGSLDYVWLKGFFIFDLKDLYLSIFIGFVILGMILNKELMKMNEKTLIKEFAAYFKVKYLKR
ncbi:MAG TPA: signal peptidase II [Mobilitalea sp.]|nr:signal peptidase II [Mobilitalea sp.]